MTTQKHNLIILLLPVLLFTGCNKHVTENYNTNLVQINLQATPNTTSHTKATTDNIQFKDNTTDIFNIIAYSAPSVISDDIYIMNEKVNSTTSGAIEFASPKYYPINPEKKLYFYAYSSTNNVTKNQNLAPLARYTITGQQDIISSQILHGIGKSSSQSIPQEQPNFVFKHKLKQVKFAIASNIGVIVLKSIKIKSAKTTAILNITEDVLTWDAPLSNLTAYENINGLQITNTLKELEGCVMFEPGTTFDIILATSIGPEIETTIKLTGENAGEEGVSHTVNITFINLLTKSTNTEQCNVLTVNSHINSSFK